MVCRELLGSGLQTLAGIDLSTSPRDYAPMLLFLCALALGIFVLAKVRR